VLFSAFAASRSCSFGGGLFCCRYAIAQQPGNGGRVVGGSPRQPPAEVCRSLIPPFGAAAIVCQRGLYVYDQAISWPPRFPPVGPRDTKAWRIALIDGPVVEWLKPVPARDVRFLPNFAPLGAEVRSVWQLFDFQFYYLPKYFCTIVPNSPRIELFRILLDRVFNRTQSQWTSTCIKSHRIVRLTGING